MEYYYKIIKEDYMSQHSQEPYRIGLNIDPLRFSRSKRPGTNGIYFSTKTDVMSYILDCNHTIICKLHVPDKERVIKLHYQEYEPIKFKAHSIIIDEMHDFSTIDGIEWCKKEGIRIYWESISAGFDLSKEFIRKYDKELNWDLLSTSMTLTDDLIKEYEDRVNWDNLSKRGYINIDFLREFQDKVNWKNVSGYYSLSEDMLLEFKDKIDWVQYLWYNKNIPDSVKAFLDVDLLDRFGITRLEKEKEIYKDDNENEAAKSLYLDDGDTITIKKKILW